MSFSLFAVVNIRYFEAYHRARHTFFRKACFVNFAKTAEKLREELGLSGATYVPGSITIGNVPQDAHTDSGYVIATKP